MHTVVHLKILKYLESNPKASQRHLAQELGVSVGKVNYCLKALIFKDNIFKSFFFDIGLLRHLVRLSSREYREHSLATRAILLKILFKMSGWRNRLG